MAEFKFSCPQCAQHLSGNEQWSGHQIQCPTCATTLTVPQFLPAPAVVATVPKSLVPQPPAPHGARLSAGTTQVARSIGPGTIPIRQPTERPPGNKSSLVKYVVYAIVLAALGGAGYLYVPSLLSKLQDSENSKPTQANPAPNGGGVGPMGEVNGAMDMSDAMEGGRSSKPPPATARQPAAAHPPTTPAANPAARATNDAMRTRFRQPGQTDPASGGHR
jgi:hypothetical protein